MFLSFYSADTPIIIVVSLAILVLILLIAAIILIKLKKKPKAIKVNSEFIDSLITNYGGLENIKGVEIENSRLKIEVDDLDIVNLESIKANTTAGVFVTGNTVKTLYKLSSEEIKRSLDQRLKEK